MMSKKVVLLDGRSSGDMDLVPTLAILTDVLIQIGAEVQVFSLREMKLAHCIGDFDCWLKTPGICRFGDAGREVLEAVIQSDTTILFTPVVFGGYSSQLKQIVDRFASLVLPYFGSYHGEMHHRPRYSHFPRLVGIGVQPQVDVEEAGLFKLLVGRNAINFHASSFAVEVIRGTEDPDAVREVFWSLLARKDALPWGAAIQSILPAPEAFAGWGKPAGERRACLIVGSPKTLSPSTSAVLGNALLDKLKACGWETEALTLKPGLLKEQGQAELVSAVKRADLLLFAFPLYCDALPFLMAKALEVISGHQQASDHPRPQYLFAIANNGFVESYQNNLALSICQRFAVRSGMTWVGGLALGAGEAISGGQPLKPMSAFGVPCFHVIQALEAAGTALAQGQAIPVEAIRGIAQNPIPRTPFAFWRWIATFNGNRQMWDKHAAENGVSRDQMLACPYAGYAEN